jgi:small GTP-binding protein
LWDTAGQERFRTITSSFYRGAHGVALCYDVASKESFGNITNWIKQLDEYAKKRLPKVLCALKTDIGGREVTESEGKELAAELDMQFIECSAKDGKNVEMAFETLVKVISADGDGDDD